ncbi:gliding motility lipoprotein GldD [Psychroflexus planctonicus]|uniref:Gliding motility lipoprotein GldD n=1 Tax=Psychroflexus planctonicus TaxID=1526575 RepID=A0ABQ1SHQ7_9FLAO|nr:gliding motility lipoprotein GldD [Psychroflexus planctonicus]GGE40647.1 gliding motility lipoprotein GldD [Psychroflexus planctonicus]
MQIKPIYLSLLFVGLILACNNKEFQPKPDAQLALTYDQASYKFLDIENCPFQFEMNSSARLKKPKSPKECWTNVYYPKQKATIFITYNSIENNLDDYLRDAQKLPLKHSIKAEKIEASQYQNPKQNTYGTFYEVEGDAASQAQFYLTDSIQHFLTGSIYFEAAPNYDSILPAAEYLKKDIRHIMETLSWK